MKDDQYRLLSLVRGVPARLTVPQVAFLLNCRDYDIPVLVAAKLLKPLGNPPVNAVKYFCAKYVLERCQDTAWLARVTNAIHDYWRRKTRAKKAFRQIRAHRASEDSNADDPESNGLSPGGTH